MRNTDRQKMVRASDRTIVRMRQPSQSTETEAVIQRRRNRGWKTQRQQQSCYARAARDHTMKENVAV